MVASTGKSIEIKCRRCGKMAKAEDFTLDYVYKMAVCPSCVKERKSNDAKTLKQAFKEVEHESAPEAPKKQNPPGWDAEDEYLEKLARQKQKAEAPAQRESTPKPYQMGGMPNQVSYNQPKPSSMAEPSSMQRMPARPPQSQEAAKPMSIADFGMRSTGKPTTATPASKPAEAPKTADNPQSEHHSILSERAEKAGTDPNKTKYKCKKCGYEFWFNRETCTPRSCPYCSTQVMHLI